MEEFKHNCGNQRICGREKYTCIKPDYRPGNNTVLDCGKVKFAVHYEINHNKRSRQNNEYYKQLCAIAEAESAQVLPICAKLEEEIAALEPEEREMFLEEMGMEQSGLDRMIKCSYALLGLISFLTCGPDECRAWTIKNGTKAPQAAGKIHTDFERGFIRAEIVAFDDLRDCGSMAVAKERGLVRSEGKDYVMKDGDVTLFRFNV